MKQYKIEHIGIAVSDPIKMANWYRKFLNFKIKFAAEDSEKAVAFVARPGDSLVVLEDPWGNCIQNKIWIEGRIN